MDKNGLLELAVEHYSATAIELLGKAIGYAEIAHITQFRASGEPYITHPLTVASFLITWKLDIDSVIAAVLHDTVEDTTATIEDIEQNFGKDVAFLVSGVTKVSAVRSNMQDITSYLPKTKDNLSKLLIAVSQDVRVLLVKLADRLHNLQTLQYLPKEKQIKIARESLEVFAPLADRLGFGRLRVQIEELAFMYLDPAAHHRTSQLLHKRLGRSLKFFDETKALITQKLNEASITFSIDSRLKSTYSLYKKLKKYDNDIEQIYDLMAIRIIVSNSSECYQTLGVIHNLFQPILTKIKDYIAVPKPNGYQSLHTTVITPSKRIIEIQIRTASMHEHAERGLSASFHYNEQKVTKNYTARNVEELPPALRWVYSLQRVYDRLQSGEQITPGELALDLFADRIFVYSPKGDIYDLPEGSYPLDFAFAIHSDLGLHAHTFTVNGKISSFNSPLKNGDIVNVTIRSNIKPKNDWLECVRTAKARQKIRAALQITSAKH